MNSSNCSSGSCETTCPIHRLGNFIQPFLLLAIRLFWGYLLFLAGTAKLADLEGTAAFFQSLNIPFSAFTSQVVAYVEVITGICLMLGFATRYVSIAVIIVMLTAIFTAHRDMAFHLTPPFPFLFAALILLSFGAGQISLDYILQRLFCKKS